MNRPFASCLMILLSLFGCNADETKPSSPPVQAAAKPTSMSPAKIGCVGCHDDVQLDPAHRLACTSCHGGLDNENLVEKAHTGLVALPGHPDRMTATCGGCHPQQVAAAAKSPHFTLANKINTIRGHFGAHNRLTAPAEIPASDSFANPLALADDMLRRRCLRCHVYAKGDDYAAVTHGTGCAACHLSFKDGKMVSHAFVAPTDNSCLHCHYGNYVGSDYHGRSEHDFNWEYRTPYFSSTNRNTAPRPLGVESHNFTPDIHQQRGLVCIDCHRNSGHDQGPALTCRTCHDWKSGQNVPSLDTLRLQDQTLILVGVGDGKEHIVPSLRHPAHRQYGHMVACQVCHGQWSFSDAPTHLLLTQRPDYEPWERLTVQGSSEIESLLEHNLNYSQEKPLTMRDGLTGASRPGVWYQGYGQRRWEQMIVGKDKDGVIKVFRPILDLHLSMVDAGGQVPFDNVTGQNNGLLPYTPHTTGPAGLFFRDRFRHLLTPDAK